MTKKTLIIMLCILVGLVLAGCNSEKPKQPEVEVVSPTGCLMSQGRYYDPKLRDCVKATSLYQARVLFAYRYVNKLAEEGKLPETEYAIDFKTYISIEKAEMLWGELRDQGARMLVLSGSMPDDYGYDNPAGSPNPTGLKSWGAPGSGGGAGCGWHHSFDMAPDGNTLESMLLASIKTMEADPAFDARPRPELRKAILEDKDCRIESMNVIVGPAVMRSFWNHHLDDIEAISPLVNDLDTIQPGFGPMQPYREGE